MSQSSFDVGQTMDFHVRLPLILCLIATFVRSADDDAHLSNLLDAVKSALYSGASLDNLYRRPQDFDYSPSNGISLGVYEALLSITQNDDLECVPRLLCEAAAGGRPGYSGRDIKFDKASLTKFISYLNLGPAKSSPLLTFARAALLGVSNRGDPYACIINYGKCPKDQSRLLHYLNNHRGGFFQYFDRRETNNNQYQNQYNRPSYLSQYNKYLREPLKYKKNRIKFEQTNFYNNLKKKAVSGGPVYANKYSYSSLKFPNAFAPSGGNRQDSRKRMVFPAVDEGDRGGRRIRGYLKVGDPRILHQSEKESFFKVSLDNRPKKGKASSGFFFPEEGGDGNGFGNRYASLATDRLPSLFNVPQADESPEGTGGYENYGNENGQLNYNSFFPK